MLIIEEEKKEVVYEQRDLRNKCEDSMRGGGDGPYFGYRAVYPSVGDIDSY